jgi:DNA-binding transcriptional LysR family regulator
VALAELGIGLACVPDFAVRRQIAEGSLVRILGEYIEHIGVVSVVWPSSQHRSPKLRAFVDYMAEHLLKSPPPSAANDRHSRKARAPWRAKSTTIAPEPET